MLNFFKKKKSYSEIRRERYRKEDQEKFERKMNAIKNIARRNMEKGERKNFLPYKENVVVPYEDLLKIWDIADRAKWDTPVR